MTLRTQWLNFTWHFRYRLANNRWHPHTAHYFYYRTIGWLINWYDKKQSRAGYMCLNCRTKHQIPKKYKTWNGKQYIDFSGHNNCADCGSDRLSFGMRHKREYQPVDNQIPLGYNP